jgi:hypothetical protein
VQRTIHLNKQGLGSNNLLTLHCDYHIHKSYVNAETNDVPLQWQVARENLQEVVHLPF